MRKDFNCNLCQLSVKCGEIIENLDMGQVTELWLSYYLVLLSIDSKTR